jgi:hypothetical protein
LEKWTRKLCLLSNGLPGEVKVCERKCDLECARLLLDDVYFDLRNHNSIGSELAMRISKFCGIFDNCLQRGVE